MALPGIIPRLRNFAHTGFGWLAHMMAVIYHAVRLLPQGHPYVNPANIGRFGIRHVIGEASRHLVIKKENIDQIIIFTALLLGFIILIFQFVFIILALMMKSAFAAVFAGMFATANPEYDIAYMMLDSVFGIPGFFGSCVDVSGLGPGTTCLGAYAALPSFPTPFQLGMHRLFNFYNMAILIVAFLVFLYYVMIMVAETAHTGTPFGRRFNHIWGPLRLVVALGLLIPINYGLNSAQYITLFAAKMGSSFATNGWYLFNNSLTNSLGLGNSDDLVAEPTLPETNAVTNFMLLVQACRIAYDAAFPDDPTTAAIEGMEIRPYLVKGSRTVQEITGPATAGSPPSATPTWAQARAFYDNEDIIIRFGQDGRDPSGAAPFYTTDKYPWTNGGVFPFCGEITIHTKDLSMPGATLIQEMYYNWITLIWFNIGGAPFQYLEFGNRVRCMYGEDSQKTPLPGPEGRNCNTTFFGAGDNVRALPHNDWYHTLIDAEQSYMDGWVTWIFNDFRTNQLPTLEVAAKDDIITINNRGWAAAGMWYNNIAQWNGSLFSAVKSIPTPSRMPSVMEKIEKFRRSHNEATDGLYRYEPELRGENMVPFDIPAEANIAKGLNHVYQYVFENGQYSIETKSSGNIFYDIINKIFGTSGLFDLRNGTNDSVNPLAQLVAIGKSIIDSTIRNMGVALGFSAGGGMLGVSDPHMGQFLNGISSGMVGITTIGLTVGFLLYYVLPFLPFIYFFFAVGTWVKSIFEAMVGAPLWALAHLRIDGNGLPGETAMNGYFMIMEIFLRPILSVFGLLASIIIFSAMVKTLNGIFSLVVENLTGFNCTRNAAGACTTGMQAGGFMLKRTVIDEFFFTIIYTILVYLMATSSFKLIDQIPDNIMRWMGTGVKNFGGQDGDPAQGLTQYAAFGGSQIASQAIEAGVQGSRTLGQGAGAVQTLAKRLMGSSARGEIG